MLLHSRLNFNGIIFIVSILIAIHSSLFAQIGYVDYRQILLNHPLIRNFNFDNRRFANTPSAWVADKKQAIINYNEALKKLQTESIKLDRQYRSLFKKIMGKSKNDRLFYIWHRKAEIKLLMLYIQKAKQICKTNEPYLHGAATGVETLVPILNQIDNDIHISISALSRKYGHIPIMDMSCLVTSSIQSGNDCSLLYSNFHRKLWTQSDIKPDNFIKWKKSLKTFLINNYANKKLGPFVYGFKDLRQEAVKNMSLIPVK